MGWISDLDKIRDKLKEKYPEWNIWYVPHAVTREVTWCAQPKPILNQASADWLENAIGETEAAWKKEGVRTG
jgi:hypothetical protein